MNLKRSITNLVMLDLVIKPVNFFTFLPPVILLTACVSTPPSTIDSLVINNQTRHLAKDVTLHVIETQEIFSCSQIMPRAFCSIDFPKRENEGNTATLSWIQNGEFYKQRLKASNKNEAIIGANHGVVVEILDYGELEVRME